jgi:hypothetical protein
MKRCAKCGASHDDEVAFCDCGADIRLTLSEEVKKGSGARSTGSGYKTHESRYPALDAVGSAYAFLGWLVIVSGILFGIFSIFVGYRADGFGAGVVVGMGAVLGSIVLGLPMLACRDVIQWMLDLQGHARRSEDLLSHLKASR